MSGPPARVARWDQRPAYVDAPRRQRQGSELRGVGAEFVERHRDGDRGTRRHLDVWLHMGSGIDSPTIKENEFMKPTIASDTYSDRTLRF
ncbi:hypothetical protein Nham_4616 (plasmid) [Nitrobacter hamburgensis X14]|uniref:Uncharacterized protein n=1 Tax=Nitrobacter hamburgensis (strain DSM 10229 / NCIMB 13809 / X14) TaxID=323097 RepID=Q1QF19_NITHX|nr:hypothetical protein Nham_4616 [Nitrobacter hamburgensis X14]